MPVGAVLVMTRGKRGDERGVHHFVGADAEDHVIQDSPSLAFDHRLHEPHRAAVVWIS
jgi:hypothetical protein